MMDKAEVWSPALGNAPWMDARRGAKAWALPWSF
jgi:hypothetical protein